MSGADKNEIQKYEPKHEKGSSRMGRPPKYGDEILEQAMKYLEGGWVDVKQAIPSLTGLALYLGIVSSTIYDWRDKYEDFSSICKSILDMEENCLKNNGLNGVFNPTITKLILSKHGYSDKVDVDNTSSDGSMANKGLTIDPSKLTTDQLRALREAIIPDETQST